MQFSFKKPFLKVIITDLRESALYFQKRIDFLLSTLKEKYFIKEQHCDEYEGVHLTQCIVFEHDNKRFKLIDLSDPDNGDHASFFEIIKKENCQFVLKSQYNPNLNIPKLRPFFYFEKSDPELFSGRLLSLRSIKKNNNELYWRGSLHDSRKNIIFSIKNLLNTSFEKSIHSKLYFEELALHKVALSLPGGGNSCHREFECFGIGTVVLSPKFKNIYHIPLIPNYHYLCIDGDEEKDIIKNIRYRFENLKDDEINFIRSNAIEYYDNYIEYKKNAFWTRHCLEL
jgi:hypothetical protein